MKQGWEIKILDDVCTFERGLTYAKGDEVNISSKGVLRSNNIDLITNTLNYDEIKYLREDFEIPAKKKVRKNSLLMCISNGSKIHLGKVALIDDDIDYAFGGFMGLLIPDETIIHPRYFYYSLISPMYKSFVKGLSDGANINNLKFADIKSFSIAVPPLAEQERIVEILDREFERIDALKANAEQNLQHAKDLFQSALKQELQPKEGWKSQTFSDEVDVINGRAYRKEELLSKGKYRVLRVGNFFTNDSWYYSDLELSDDKYCDYGDLLYAWSASFGPKIWKEEKVIYHYHIWKMVSKNGIDTHFLYYWLQSPHLTTQVMSNLHGTTMAHITKGIMESTTIQFPEKQEQNAVVARLDKLKEHCKALEENYTKTIALCDDMKQALLRKAFNGEL